MNETAKSEQGKEITGVMSEQGMENLAAIEQLWKNATTVKCDADDVKRFTDYFAWCREHMEDNNIIPDNGRCKGYNPKTGAILEPDDPKNNFEYMGNYIRKFLIPQVTQKMVNACSTE